MIKYFIKKASNKDGFVFGELWKNTGKNSFAISQKEYVLNENSSTEIKFYYILQKIVEGFSVKTILENPYSNWTPSFYEFMLWVNNNKIYKKQFHKAKVLRTQGVIESLFQILETRENSIDDETIKVNINILSQISKALAKDLEDEDVNMVDVTIVNVDHITQGMAK